MMKHFTRLLRSAQGMMQLNGRLKAYKEYSLTYYTGCLSTVLHSILYDIYT